jgi:hypothetical protein
MTAVAGKGAGFNIDATPEWQDPRREGGAPQFRAAFAHLTLWMVTPGQSSVRNGVAGRPSAL